MKWPTFAGVVMCTEYKRTQLEGTTLWWDGAYLPMTGTFDSQPDYDAWGSTYGRVNIYDASLNYLITDVSA